MAINKKKVTIMVPAYNEERTLPALYSSLVSFFDDPLLRERYDFDVLLINDGSTDGTDPVLAEMHRRDGRFNYISLSRNFGKENAMLAGFDYVDGDCCVIMDADMQDPLQSIPEMLAYWEEGYDDIYGRRTSRGSESWLRRKLSLLFYRMLEKSSRIEMLYNVGDFRLLDRRCIRALRQLRETQRYTKGLYSWIGFRKKELTIHRNDRSDGKSAYSLGRLFNLAIDGITSFSIAPLRIASVVGVVMSTVAFIYLIYIFLKTLTVGDPVQGFPTIICTVLLIGGIQMLMIGVIGEYLGRVYNESKGRPVYIIDSYNGQKL